MTRADKRVVIAFVFGALIGAIGRDNWQAYQLQKALVTAEEAKERFEAWRNGCRRTRILFSLSSQKAK